MSRHAAGHPLAIPRVSLAIDLCRALGWLSDVAYREAPIASLAELGEFHTPEYVSAVMRAEAAQAISDEEGRRFNLGMNGNPIYGEVFRRPATGCGASLMAARLLAPGGIVFNPAGGTHHGQPNRASGYCIFNDPVLAILELLRIGLARVFYLDLDAHFGDAVQQAFHADNRVFTLSVHEAGRWPMARDGDPLYGFGGALDRAGGAACNLPVPAGFNDSEMATLMEDAIVPLIERFAPDAIVAQCGADALADDPMTKLESVESGAMAGGRGSHATCAQAPRARRRRLQSLCDGTMLGRHLGDAERLGDAGASDRSGGDHSPRRMLAPSVGQETRRTMANHPRGSASIWASGRRGKDACQARPRAVRDIATSSLGLAGP